MKLSEVVAALTAELIANGDSVVRFIRDEDIEMRGGLKNHRVEPYTFMLEDLDRADLWNPLEIRIEKNCP